MYLFNVSASEPDRQPSSTLVYTLADIRALATEYADERHAEAKLTVQLMLGAWIAWLEKREQGKENAT